MKTIAIAGKGGTGKTTVAGLVIRLLCEKKRPILAVDADSNVNLNDVLGVELKETIGAIREEMKILADKLPAGMTKQQFLEYKIHRSLVEAQFFDLIAMGRPEGPGCYCYANDLLRDILATLSQNYEYIVIDNQAGMEHLSRRTTQNIDHLVIVSDPSPRGIRAAGKISRLVKELETRVKEKFLALNRVQDSIPASLKEAIAEEGLKLLSVIPEDKTLLEMDQEGKSIWEIPASSPAYKAIAELCQKIIINK
jgi:CO dehydrogenase maturation factor